ncbi:MAG: hypothetical protein ACM3PY_13465, partial [Omnitrophica WOR_2 bacterium]
KQMVIAVLVVAIIYLFLLGRQGAARDILLDGDYAYVALGNFGGVRVLDIHDPTGLREIGHADIRGTAQKLYKIGNVLFVATGESGLQLFDVTNPAYPVQFGSQETNGNTQDVTVLGKYAYLADGNAGLGIVDLSDPAHPVEVNRVDVGGNAQAVKVVTMNLLPASAASSQKSQLQAQYVFVAAGNKGLVILDASLPTAPQVVGDFDTPGDAHDVAIVGHYAVIADGKRGLRLADITDPTAPAHTGDLNIKGEALRLSVIGQQVMVADGSRGLVVVNIDQAGKAEEAYSYETPGIAYAVAVKGTDAFLADGTQGLKVIDLSRPEAPYQFTHYETPGEASFGQILQAFWTMAHGNFGAVQGKVWRTLLVILFDVFLLLIITIFWMAFFAQFVLPVRTLRERRRVIDRLFAYHTGNPGQAIFIENGEFKEREREVYRSGPGVALLDTASAAVFRNEHAFTQVAGPGIVFTRMNEYPAGTVDLHRQSRTLGPVEKEDPFAPRGERETLEDYQSRQDRRYSTSALTRDGVEVVSNVSTSFKLNSTSGEGNTMFGYDPQSVWGAIAREGINPSALPGSDKRIVSWDWLPSHLAVDLWREYLRKFTLDELFTISENPEQLASPGERRTAYDTITTMIRERMISPEVEELDDMGRPTGVKKASKEYEILKERGIQILSLGVRRLLFPREVENQLVEQWKGSWLKRAHDEMKEIERYHAEARNTGQDQAWKEYASSTSQVLAGALATNPEIDMATSLELLVQGTLKLCLRDLDLAPRLTNQKTTLVDLIEWIRKQEK